MAASHAAMTFKQARTGKNQFKYPKKGRLENCSTKGAKGEVGSTLIKF
jgi:hypothetical protein